MCVINSLQCKKKEERNWELFIYAYRYNIRRHTNTRTTRALALGTRGTWPRAVVLTLGTYMAWQVGFGYRNYHLLPWYCRAACGMVCDSPETYGKIGGVLGAGWLYHMGIRHKAQGKTHMAGSALRGVGGGGEGGGGVDEHTPRGKTDVS